MLIAILSIFVLGIIAPFLFKVFKDNTNWVLAALPFGLFIYFLSLLPEIASGHIIRESTPWVSLFDVNLSFYLDGLSILFALLVTGIGTFIVLYGGGYLKGDTNIPRFYSSLLIFMGSMLGLVLADNMISLFVFWELTSFSSYLLIGYYHESEESRKCALQALLVTGIGGLAMLAGFVLMSFVSGTFEISEMLVQGDVFRDSELYFPILLLILAGAFTKSAQFPFHFWLPGAMAAPTPVSAYLHSATMVKAGVYLLARLHPGLGDTNEWFYIVTITGAITLLISAWLSITFRDLKQILAYSTVMALGTLTMLLGMGHEAAIKAAAVFILVHSLYKGALFMVAGAIDHEAGTRDVYKLGGLRKMMPLTATAGILTALSMAGISPLFGFIGKELIYEAALSVDNLSVILITIAVVSNIAIVAASGLVALRPFFGEEKSDVPKHAHEAPLTMWIGPVILAALGLIFGLLPFLIDAHLITHVAGAIAGTEMDFYLSLWHGVNLALILSILTLAGGIAVYFSWDWLHKTSAMTTYNSWFARGPRSGYEFLLNGMLSIATWQTNILQNGMLRYYLMIITVTMISAVGYTFITKVDMTWIPEFTNIAFYEWTLAVVMIGAMLIAVTIRSRLSIIVCLGIIGFSLSVVYILYGAADLAMTQILVETLTVILVALVFIHLPNLADEDKDTSRLRDAIIAIGAGAMVTVMTLAAISLPFDGYLSEWFAAASYPEAHGRNIVNVILVDFRALDTMGEVVVLAVAGIAVYALIKMKGIFKKDEEGA